MERSRLGEWLVFEGIEFEGRSRVKSSPFSARVDVEKQRSCVHVVGSSGWKPAHVNSVNAFLKTSPSSRRLRCCFNNRSSTHT